MSVPNWSRANLVALSNAISMKEVLFDNIIFGPIASRRLGRSLGVNLLPVDIKFCNFDCLYCECGWTKVQELHHEHLPESSAIIKRLIEEIKKLQHAGETIDSITFAGNGEPTLHPQFASIAHDVILVRDLLLPEVELTILSNGTMLHKDEVREAMMRFDNCILKLDAGTEDTFQLINRPLGGVHLEKITDQYAKFRDKLTIQTLFFKGKYHGVQVDNTSEKELSIWLRRIAAIRPKKVMLYSLDRETPTQGLEQINTETLNQIATQVRKMGIEALVA